MIIGLVGFIGAGKGTVADILVEKHGFIKESFANSVKDAVSVIFGWDRTFLKAILQNPEAGANNQMSFGQTNSAKNFPQDLLYS